MSVCVCVRVYVCVRLCVCVNKTDQRVFSVFAFFFLFLFFVLFLKLFFPMSEVPLTFKNGIYALAVRILRVSRLSSSERSDGFKKY